MKTEDLEPTKDFFSKIASWTKCLFITCPDEAKIQREEEEQRRKAEDEKRAQ
ncbi:MAG: hypothetical protein ACKO96_00970 [Flammeovirgaceae bacterium]|jgi:hypothetical protein